MQQTNQINNKIFGRRKSVDNLIRFPVLPEDIPVAKEISPPRKNIYSGLKMIGVAVLIFALFAGLSSVGGTVSYFSDIETSIGNKLQAGILGFANSLKDTSENNLLLASAQSVNVLNSDTVENISNKQFSVNVEESDGSLPATYTVSGLLDPGNPVGCDKLNITASLGDYNYYDGLFTLFTSTQISEMGEWQFLVSLPVDNTELEPNAICKGEVIFSAGLADVAEELIHTYTDEKRYPFELKNWGEEPITKVAPILEDTSTPDISSPPAEVIPEPAIVESVLVPPEDSTTSPTEGSGVEIETPQVAPVEAVTEEPVSSEIAPVTDAAGAEPAAQ